MTASIPDVVALARDLYQQGVSVAEILATTKISIATLYRWLDGDEAGVLPPLPRRRGIRGLRRLLPNKERTSLVARLWRTAERQVRDIEERLARGRQEPSEFERDARLLAVLVKTLRELSALDPTEAQNTEDADDAHAEPVDIDAFRNEIAQRLARLRRERRGESVGEPDA
jgi:hypothetical protein